MLRRSTRLPPARAILWRRHAALARRSGLDRFYVLLSFDCDTDRDTEVVPGVAERLARLGISASFAVPGEQLRRGRAVYGPLFEAGHEFIAHGDHEHCVLVGGKYVSSFFYDQLDRATVATDIERATATFIDILGHRPRGYRVPHFGTFQGVEELAFLHSRLRDLGYGFSTSTLPLYASIHGPIRRFGDGFVEVPVSGQFTSPLSVLDSFSFLSARPTEGVVGRYADEFMGLVRYFVERGWPGLMNTYADPSQVHASAAFWRSIELVASLGVPTLRYSHLLELVAA